MPRRTLKNLLVDTNYVRIYSLKPLFIKRVSIY